MAISSGVTALATDGNDDITVLSAGQGGAVLRLLVLRFNASKVGFFSLDGGTVWHLFGTNASVNTIMIPVTFRAGDTLKVKRVADGPDVTGIYASVF